MSAFTYELAAVMAAQAQATQGHADGLYSMPWYLVIGEPGSGRSTAIKALNLSWPRGDQAVATNSPTPQCDYWMPEKAIFIEPGKTVLGQARQQGALQELCYELKAKRPREPIDGVIVVLSTRFLASAGEEDVERYANSLRRYLIEVAQALDADIPTYVVASAFDDLWGFGDAFQWTAARRDEEPWGFSLPPSMPAEQTVAALEPAFEGVRARIEAMCFDKLASEAPADVRIRSYQHLAEALAAVQRLEAVMKILSLSNSFERAPWIRALAIGSGHPGTGQRMRYRIGEFVAMGYTAPQQSGTPQPGGMPLHGLLDAVLLPERDLVPTKTRWRDDTVLIVLLVVGVLAWIAAVIVFLSQK